MSINFMKTYRRLILLILVSLFVYASCAFPRQKPINKDKIVQQDIELKTFSADYELKDNKITTLFYENGFVPFVGVMEFISSLDGYFESSLITYNEENDKLILSWKNEEDTYWMSIDHKNDLIEVNDTTFFSFTNDPTFIDYNRHFKSENIIVEGGKNVIFDLGKYDFDIFPYNNDFIIPFNVLNTLFLMQNVGNMIYNGRYYFFPYYLDSYEEMYEVRNNSSVSSRYSKDFIENRNNGLYFTLDYFYGLKDYKNIDSFKDKIVNMYGEDINSDKPKISEDILKHFLIHELDDPHTNMGFSSFYKRIGLFSDIFVPVGNEDFNERNKNISETQYYLTNLYEKVLGKNELVRYSGNTAFIKFDEFMVGYDDEIFDPLGNVSEDAYLFDTFYLMKKALDDISRNNHIKNVVIDLSTNGGGVLASCFSALGFLTNDNILAPSKDVLNDTKMLEEISVDTNCDGVFSDKDAYDQYKYYVLTSESTFSAANYFTSICKDMKIATIIGQKSGGGMCSVSEVALLDGLTFGFSSNYCLQSATKDNGNIIYKDIEEGILPDIYIDYSKFYDLEYINNLINLQ